MINEKLTPVNFYIIRVPFLYTKLVVMSKAFDLPTCTLGKLYNYYIPISYSKSCDIDIQRPRVHKFYKTYEECLNFCISRNQTVDSAEYDTKSMLNVCLKRINNRIRLCDIITRYYKTLFQ